MVDPNEQRIAASLAALKRRLLGLQADQLDAFQTEDDQRQRERGLASAGPAQGNGFDLYSSRLNREGDIARINDVLKGGSGQLRMIAGDAPRSWDEDQRTQQMQDAYRRASLGSALKSLAGRAYGPAQGAADAGTSSDGEGWISPNIFYGSGKAGALQRKLLDAKLAQADTATEAAKQQKWDILAPDLARNRRITDAEFAQPYVEAMTARQNEFGRGEAMKDTEAGLSQQREQYFDPVTRWQFEDKLRLATAPAATRAQGLVDQAIARGQAELERELLKGGNAADIEAVRQIGQRATAWQRNQMTADPTQAAKEGQDLLDAQMQILDRIRAGRAQAQGGNPNDPAAAFRRNGVPVR